MNAHRALTASLTLAALAGCSTASITGEVDGDVIPPFMTGMVFEANAATPDDDYVALAAFYTFSDGCDLVAEQTDKKADGVRGLVNGNDVERLIDDVRTFEEDNLPDDYWAAYVIVAARSESDIEDDFEIDEDPASVLVCHHTGAVDAPRDEPAAALLPDYAVPFAKDSNRDCYQASKGDVQVSLYSREKISLTADVSLVNEDADSAGKIELSGVATECASTEDAVDGLFREVEDLAAASAEPAPGGGNDSCQFAFDGECDEPGIGTGACDPGTDATDC